MRDCATGTTSVSAYIQSKDRPRYAHHAMMMPIVVYVPLTMQNVAK